MGDGRQGTAHRPTRFSQPCGFAHTLKTRGRTLTQTHVHSRTHTRQESANDGTARERTNERGFLFFRRYCPVSPFPPCVFYFMTPCKKSFYGLPRPHGYECGEVDCGSFRTPPGQALSSSDKRASPESCGSQNSERFNLTSSSITESSRFFSLFISKGNVWESEWTQTRVTGAEKRINQADTKKAISLCPNEDLLS